MRKFYVVGALLALMVGVSQAEGYVGASFGRGKSPMDCAQGAACKDAVSVFKLYAGTKLSDESQVDLVVTRMDAFEVAYVRTVNRAQRVSSVTQRYTLDESGVPNTYERIVPFRQRLGVDAIVMTPVFHVPVTNAASLFLKPGVGVVTTTINTDVNGQNARSDSSIRVKPYVAMGLDYILMEGVKIFGSAEWLGYAVQGESGALRSVNLGAQVDF